MDVRAYREYLMAFSYLAGGGLQALGIIFHILGLIALIGFALILRKRKHAEERYQFSFWQAILWHATAFLLGFLGGFWNYSNAQSLVTALLVAASGLLVYIVYTAEKPPKIPVLYELAEMIMGKTVLR